MAQREAIGYYLKMETCREYEYDETTYRFLAFPAMPFLFKGLALAVSLVYLLKFFLPQRNENQPSLKLWLAKKEMAQREAIGQ